VDVLFGFFQGQIYKCVLEERRERWSTIIHDEEAIRRLNSILNEKTEEERQTLQFCLELEEYKKSKNSKNTRNRARELVSKYVQPCKIVTLNEFIIEIEEAIVCENYTKNTFSKVEEHGISLLSKYCRKGLLPSPSPLPSPRRRPRVVVPHKHKVPAPKTFKSLVKDPSGLIKAYQNTFGYHVHQQMSLKMLNVLHPIDVQIIAFPHIMFELLFVTLLSLDYTTQPPYSKTFTYEHTITVTDEQTLENVFGKKWLTKEIELSEENPKGLMATIQLPFTIVHKEQEHLLLFEGSYVVSPPGTTNVFGSTK